MKLIRFRRGRGGVSAAELREAYSRIQLARLAQREADRYLRTLCERAQSGESVEPCEYHLDHQLGMIFERVEPLEKS